MAEKMGKVEQMEWMKLVVKVELVEEVDRMWSQGGG